MSKIYLSGGGDIKDSYDFDKMFFNNISSDSPILYIATAMAINEEKRNSCRKWFSELITRHTKDENYYTFNMTDTDLKKIQSFDKYTAIYVGGGNTYRLLDTINKTEVKNLIKRLLETNIVYYGGSAGAIILGKSLLTVREERRKEGLSSEGFNLLDGYSIFPHFENSKEQIKQIKELCNDYKLNILAIPEGSGIILEDGEKTVFGKVFSFTYEKKEITIYNSGEVII